MKIKEEYIIFGIIGLILLFVFLPLMDNAYFHDELFATSAYHEFTPINPPPQSFEATNPLMWARSWKDFSVRHPPLFLIFFKVWSLIILEEESLMRFPLLISYLFSAFLFFKILGLYFKRSESALYTLCLLLSSWWYGPGVLLAPETFTPLFFLALFYLFNKDIYLGKSLRRNFLFLSLISVCYNYALIIPILAFNFFIFINRNILDKNSRNSSITENLKKLRLTYHCSTIIPSVFIFLWLAYYRSTNVYNLLYSGEPRLDAGALKFLIETFLMGRINV